MFKRNQSRMTRRSFNAVLVAAAIGMSLGGRYGFRDNNGKKADGLLNLSENGKIYIHSGGGHLGLYAQENATSVITEILNSPREHFVVNYGENPAQLPNLLAQHSNHLSFSSEKTNIRAATVLKAELKKRASVLLGGRSDEYLIENGFAIRGTKQISFAELARNCRTQLIEPDISEKTYQMISMLDGKGVIVAVGQVG